MRNNSLLVSHGWTTAPCMWENMSHATVFNEVNCVRHYLESVAQWRQAIEAKAEFRYGRSVLCHGRPARSQFDMQVHRSAGFPAASRQSSCQRCTEAWHVKTHKRANAHTSPLSAAIRHRTADKNITSPIRQLNGETLQQSVLAAWSRQLPRRVASVTGQQGGYRPLMVWEIKMWVKQQHWSQWMGSVPHGGRRVHMEVILRTEQKFLLKRIMWTLVRSRLIML